MNNDAIHFITQLKTHVLTSINFKVPLKVSRKQSKGSCRFPIHPWCSYMRQVDTELIDLTFGELECSLKNDVLAMDHTYQIYLVS